MFSLLDFLDNVAYYGNWPDRVFSLFVQAVSPSKGGRFGGMVQFKVPCMDKNDQSPGIDAVLGLMKKGGVRTFYYLHDANYMYFSVRKSQEKQARWLYDEESMQMRPFAHPWSEKTKQPAKPTSKRKPGKRKPSKQKSILRQFGESLLK